MAKNRRERLKTPASRDRGGATVKGKRKTVREAVAVPRSYGHRHPQRRRRPRIRIRVQIWRRDVHGASKRYYGVRKATLDGLTGRAHWRYYAAPPPGGGAGIV